jgi:hypothetical protein
MIGTIQRPEERAVTDRGSNADPAPVYELARRRDIPGRSKMGKSELIAALRG